MCIDVRSICPDGYSTPACIIAMYTCKPRASAVTGKSALLCDTLTMGTRFSVTKIIGNITDVSKPKLCAFTVKGPAGTVHTETSIKAWQFRTSVSVHVTDLT
jgi:hypothetical protein